ncbi:MAG TPA: alkene reductase [Lentisphaeria bacterium]|nr:MAG: alkene reductase [Lentisphaerae bacterium GWF2_38_69]HBM15907.1 alkene reductase [Lentisphaeria bacterium]
MSSILFTPINIGELNLKNRIIVAPCTRCRASKGRIPNDMMAKYYSDRATAGLIITEATSISPMAVGYPDTPGIWSNEQIQGWEKIVSTVHRAGGKIILQLWHVGRVSDPFYLDGKLPVAPSPIAAEGHVSLLRPKSNFVTPRELHISEIPGLIETYKQAASNAKDAGFDGVEIHGANGYLIDQFLEDSINKRTDIYGGPIENRAKFMLEVTDAVIEVFGSGRVGMHLSPPCDKYSKGDSNPLETFTYIAKELSRRKIAFILARESIGPKYIGDKLKKEFGGTYIANQGLTRDTAEKIIENGNADAVAFGSLFIANPDLPERFKLNSQLNEPDKNTFYMGGNKGYNDYQKLK